MKNTEDKVYILCYDSLDIFKDKKSAYDFYKVCYYSSEGAEKEQYASILINLQNSNVAKDGHSNSCQNIFVQKNVYGHFLAIPLEHKLTINEAIEYFDEKINPILIVSKKYGVDFNSNVPFENFGADEDDDYMLNFSKYYGELLHNPLVESIETEEISDGKYKLSIFPSVKDKITVDVKVWDQIEDVIHNLDIIEKELAKDYDINNNEIEL